MAISTSMRLQAGAWTLTKISPPSTRIRTSPLIGSLCGERTGPASGRSLTEAKRLLFPRFGVRHAPEESGFVLFLLRLKGLELDEVDLAAESGNHRAFFVPPPNAFFLIGEL